MSDVLVLQNPTSVNPTKTKIIKWVSDFSTPIRNLRENEAINAKYVKESTDVVPFNSKWQQLQNKLRLNEEQIKSYLHLPNNWNGNGANAISKNIVERALKLVQKLDYQPEIFPTARDTIQFEYEKGDNYLEIEVFIDFFILYKNVNDEEKELKIDDIRAIYNEIAAYHASFNRK